MYDAPLEEVQPSAIQLVTEGCSVEGQHLAWSKDQPAKVSLPQHATASTISVANAEAWQPSAIVYRGLPKT